MKIVNDFTLSIAFVSESFFVTPLIVFFFTILSLLFVLDEIVMFSILFLLSVDVNSLLKKLISNVLFDFFSFVDITLPLKEYSFFVFENIFFPCVKLEFLVATFFLELLFELVFVINLDSITL